MKKNISAAMENSAHFRLLLMIGCCGALAIFSSTISKSPILPIFAAYLGASGAQIGLIASMSTIPGILISYLAGHLADKYGYKKILVGSLLVFASAPFIYLLVQNPLQLGALRFYHGFATAAFGPVAMAAVASFSGKNTGQNLSLYSSATMVGRALAPSVGGYAYSGGGPAAVYLAAGGAGTLALLFAVWFFLKRRKAASPLPPPPAKTEEGPPFMEKLAGLLKYRPLLFVGILSACVYFAYGAFEMVFPLYARYLGMPPALIGVLLSAQLAAVIIFKPFFGRASDKVGRLPMIAAGLFICAFSFFVLALTPSSAVAIGVVIVVYGLGFALTTAAMTALAADVASAGALGASLGLMSTIMDVGQTLGPPTIGAISGAHSFSAGIAALGVLMLAAALGCSVWFFRRRRLQS